ncbi:FliM/FliN family flagellar motor switch protein [Roseateles sp. DB2]|uniref:FliM/FliN family flagellar motor switch protein n=1 Tax=Roseateles sp. DB2 TaxID=3453717 RepID=UPI003EE922D4
MKDAHELVWLPEALGTALAECLQQLLDDLANSWGIGGPDAVQARLLSAQPCAEDEAPPPGSLELRDLDPLLLRDWLATALLGKAWPGSAIVGSAMRRLLHGLEEALHQRFGKVSPAGEDAAGPLPGHCGIRLQFNWCGRPMHLTLSQRQLRANGWVKRTSMPALPRIDLAKALSATPVPLLATLGQIELQLSDWLQLSPGDVLVLNKPLTEPLKVQAQSSDWCQRAQLGSNAERTHRVLRWTTG